jgi:hypothetical protein
LADAIGIALAMPLAERSRRWEALMAGVVRDDVAAWRENFVTALRGTRQAPDSERPRRALGSLIGRLGSEPPRPERRPDRDSAASTPEWRPIARG